MRLSELKSGESATIVKVMGHGGFRRRIMEMGFVRGERVEVILNAPLKDPIEYRIMGYDISLRRSEAEMVEVLSDSEADEYLARRAERIRQVTGDGNPNDPATDSNDDECASREEVLDRQSRTITVALVGNPNSGKTSLFNAISGGHEHVGNYSGVTVGAKIGHCEYKGYHFEITDLPGTYALSAYTPEERFVRHHLATQTPDVVINSVVASNIERNLYLTTELIDINPRMVVALNMYDELKASGSTLDYDSLGRMLGVPMVPVEARNNKGINDLLDTVINVYENRDERVRHIHINMGPVIDESLRKLNSDMSLHRDELPKAFPPRYWAMKMLESDKQAEESLRSCERYPVWTEIRDREAKRISEALGEDVETAFANQKYGFIQGALKETYTPGKREEVTATALIDTFVTHKLWGFPIFFALMGLMFWCTFSIGAYPQSWIEALVGWIGRGVNALMPAGALRDLIVDGIIGGVGSVIVFLPNIMILYLFIAFMEDSGYLARAAFIMDRVMHRIGVHGKSFIPLIMGFGCNVPAIMACHNAIHVLQCANSNLHPHDRGLLLGQRRRRHAGTLSAGHRRGNHHRPADAALPLPRRRDAVRHGAAPLSSPDLEDHPLAHVGQVCAVSQEDGRHDPRRIGHRLGPELLSPFGKGGQQRNPLRKLLSGTHRKGMRTGLPPAGIQLEGQRGAALGTPGQGDRRLDTQRPLCRTADRGRRSVGTDARCAASAADHRHHRRCGCPDPDPRRRRCGRINGRIDGRQCRQNGGCVRRRAAGFPFATAA